MAVKLRLRRMGKKRQPIYKVVAADVRSPRDGKYIEAIGLYNPKTEPATVELNEERALYWLNCGAQPTTTVKNLLSSNGILLRKELLKKGLSEDDVNAKIDEWKKAQESKIANKKEKAEKKKQEKLEAAKKKLEEEKAAEVQEDTASEEVSKEETAE